MSKRHLQVKMLPYFCALIVCILLAACHSQENAKKQTNIITVNLRSSDAHLYYNGTIKPIQEDLIISPAGGVISKINFHYGDFVKKGDLLFTIHSQEMENEFRETISNYLRVKQSYLDSKKSIMGTEMLYNEKIISEQEYSNEKSQYHNNFLNFIDASNKLKHYLVFMPSSLQTTMDMSVSDTNGVSKILQENMQDLTIYAQTSGIVLFPEEKSSDGVKELHAGSRIKRDDVLLNIGDLSGLSVTANISENEVNRLKVGAPAILSFASDLELELRGKIVSIAKQAKNGENIGFSLFPVVIHIPQLPPDKLNKIRVGMNAKIDMVIEDPPAIRIPIAAVFQKDDRQWVKIIDPKTEKIIDREVKTGPTTQNEVMIQSGLHSGDRVIAND
ncbi:MAG: efflux RND transporter periplasmic adaptor subunit [Gammaproteobacteria bacterium]|nr:efflux RND transporter periplasmic adaptor subunit [Gammaproteobacteria bacterium]